MYYEKQHKYDWIKRGWFWRTFVCGHWISGQIKVDKHKPYWKKHRHYRECQKCGKRVWID